MRTKPGDLRDIERRLDRDFEREPLFGRRRLPPRGRPNARLVDICSGVYDDASEVIRGS